MTQRDAARAINQMLRSCREAQEVLGALTPAEIEASLLHRLALPRALELIGEASTRVPPDIRAQYPEVPWREVVDFRNVLIHFYDRIDFAIAVAAVRDNLPVLIAQLSAILAALENTDAP